MARRPRRVGRTILALLLVLLLAAGAAGLLAMRTLVTELAVSTATDVVVQSVNAIVKDVMREGTGEQLVRLEKNAEGAVTAVSTNVAAANALAAEVLDRAVKATQENVLTVRVPLGRIFGMRLFTVPVDVVMLSSSSSGFESELTGTGINQTRHRILLKLRVDVSLFMPWRVVGTTVETEILVSETVIVGGVPESYLQWRNEPWM